MAGSSAPRRQRVLLLCEDAALSQLLRSLLRALPPPFPETIVPEEPPAGLANAAAGCTLCLLEPGAGGLRVESMLQRLAQVAPGMPVIGVLGESSREGDRAAVAGWLRAGMQDLVSVRELSVGRLADVLSQAAQTPVTQCPPARVELPEEGHWDILLAERQARFDAGTLTALGYDPALAEASIGAWKALVHPEDIDALVSAAQRALDGDPSDAAAPLYRLRSIDGSWQAVRSAGIAVIADTAGSPHTIRGRFRREATRPRVPPSLDWLGAAQPVVVLETSPPAPTAPASAAMSVDAGTVAPHDAVVMEPAPAAHGAASTGPAPPGAHAGVADAAQTALFVYQHHADGVFRIAWCNEAAAHLEGRPVSSLEGMRARDATPPADGFDIEEALTRVLQTGIAEDCDALLLGRREPPAWRRFQLSQLAEDAVLLEAVDISSLVYARTARRAEDELPAQLLHSLPLNALLVDAEGRVEQCVALAGELFAQRAAEIAGRSLRELLGTRAGGDCLTQLLRTLNTGQPGLSTLEIQTDTGRHWIECRSALLRARPGTTPRVLLVLLDIGARVLETREARAAGQQLRSALRSLPVPFYMKDIDGRYCAMSTAFERLLGVEEGMLAGKTDVEVFPDDLATELHDIERRLLDGGGTAIEERLVGVGVARAKRWCLEFPVRATDGSLIGCAGLWLAPADFPVVRAAEPVDTTDLHALAQRRGKRQRELEEATASVVNRVEDALTDSADYADVLRQLEQLVETTMQAQSLIHHVAGRSEAAAQRPLVALAPLAQEIMELERILLPVSARFEQEIEVDLPPAHCEPVAFHQILLRGIRHARRALGPGGSLCIRLARARGARRGCISCAEGFEGNYIELVIEDSQTRLGDAELASLTLPAANADKTPGIEDLAEVLALCHAQGGHLQVHRMVPSGIALHVFFRAGDPAELGESTLRSTVARFPFGRTQGRGPT
jgi:PAS domain S-box-containing protein